MQVGVHSHLKLWSLEVCTLQIRDCVTLQMSTITDSLNLSGNQGYHSIDENVRDEGEYAEKTLLGKVQLYIQCV
jgi:hypothetical protein